jgi:hypothetical protein
VERGCGAIILKDARPSSVLYKCKYFVGKTLPRWLLEELGNLLFGEIYTFHSFLAQNGKNNKR